MAIRKKEDQEKIKQLESNPEFLKLKKEFEELSGLEWSPFRVSEIEKILPPWGAEDVHVPSSPSPISLGENHLLQSMQPLMDISKVQSLENQEKSLKFQKEEQDSRILDRILILLTLIATLTGLILK